MKLENFVVVLVHPRRQGNVGAAARAMKNCGLTQLRIVGGRALGKEAKRFAVHAEDVLSKARHFKSLREALADAVRVVGFSSKKYQVGPESAELPKLAADLRGSAKHGVVALVFGREDHGLLKEEVALCTDLLRIPANTEYPVLNLAQAVLLAGYEIAIRKRSGSVRSAVASSVPRSRRELLVDEFAALLSRLSYGPSQGRNRSARILQRLSVQFDRALAEEADLQLWMGLMKRLKQRVGPCS